MPSRALRRCQIGGAGRLAAGEHAAALLVGVGFVAAGAYESARVSRLLDRAEAGRQQEAVRQRHLTELAAAQRRSRALDARIAARRAAS